MPPRKVALIAFLVAVVTVLHYFTTVNRLPLHIIYREFYLFPIILAGLWGGRKAGLITSIIVSLLYLPHIFLLSGAHQAMLHVGTDAPTEETYVGNFLALLIFNLAGFLAGAYGQARTSYLKITQAPYQPTTYAGEFLLCLDNSGVGQYAVKYFADVLGGQPGVKVTLLWVVKEKDPANIPDKEALASYQQGQTDLGRDVLESSKEVLVKGGMPAEAIQLKNLTADRKSSVSDIIMEELQRGKYHTVVLGKRELTKAQEFMFGSLGIRLVREACANVLTVKAPSNQGEVSST